MVSLYTYTQARTIVIYFISLISVELLQSLRWAMSQQWRWRR